MVTDAEAAEWHKFCETVKAKAPGLAGAVYEIPNPEDVVLRLLADRERLKAALEEYHPLEEYREPGDCLACDVQEAMLGR